MASTTKPSTLSRFQEEALIKFNDEYEKHPEYGGFLYPSFEGIRMTTVTALIDRGYVKESDVPGTYGIYAITEKGLEALKELEHEPG